MEALLGKELLTKDGLKPTAEALKDADVVGLYFSAHWCPPCRGFTPRLGEFYARVKAAKKFEVVFVSSDKDEEEFLSYYGEQAAWTALPFGDRGKKGELSKKFKVQGIPTLVLLDGKTGEVITADGRSGVAEDAEGTSFPWRPESVTDILASVDEVQSKGGQVKVADLKTRPLLLYFSAHWCPPCRAFTPQLCSFFATLVAKSPEAAILFVSGDHDEVSFENYYAEMGPEWLALPFGHPAKSKLNKALDVSGIPTLTLLGPEDPATGQRPVVTKNGRACVADALVDGFPGSWAEQPFADIAKTVDCNGSDINMTPALVVLCDAMEGDAQRTAIDAVKRFAAEDATKSGPPDLLYFFASQDAGPVAQIRKLCDVNLEEAKATLVKLDIPDGGGYYKGPAMDAITPDTIRAFLSNPGDRRQLAM